MTGVLQAPKAVWKLSVIILAESLQHTRYFPLNLLNPYSWGRLLEELPCLLFLAC